MLGEGGHSCCERTPWRGTWIQGLGRRAPLGSSMPHSSVPSSRFTHAYGRQWRRQHVLRSGRSAGSGGRLPMCASEPAPPASVCHHSDSLSSLQLSLGPGASCLRRPLRPAKCPSGHCLCALGIWAACPCTATRSPLFPPPPPAVATIPAAAPSVARGAAEWWGVHSLGRAVVRGRRGSSSDNQHRGRGHWLSKAGRKESLVEVGRQLV